MLCFLNCRNGFAYSPFIFIVVIFLFVGFLSLFNVSENHVSDSVGSCGKFNLAGIEASALSTSFSSFSFVVFLDCFNVSENLSRYELETCVSNGLNQAVLESPPVGVDFSKDNFSVDISELNPSLFKIQTKSAPVGCVSHQEVSYCMNLGFSRVVWVEK